MKKPKKIHRKEKNKLGAIAIDQRIADQFYGQGNYKDAYSKATDALSALGKIENEIIDLGLVGRLYLITGHTARILSDKNKTEAILAYWRGTSNRTTDWRPTSLCRSSRRHGLSL